MGESEFILHILDQNERFLLSLPEGAYERKVQEVGGTIGGHLRHSLEHLRELLRGIEHGEVFFEKRRRDPLISQFVEAGLLELRFLRDALNAVDAAGILSSPLRSRSSLSGDLRETVCHPSCFGRELIYVGLHFVHHMALMAVAARLQGLHVEADFGKAPATRAYEQRGAA